MRFSSGSNANTIQKLYLMADMVLDAQESAQSGDDFHTIVAAPAEGEEAHARHRLAAHPCLFTKKASRDH